VRLVVARVKYRDEAPPPSPECPEPQPTISTTEMPDVLLPRSLATPSLVAHVVTDKPSPTACRSIDRRSGSRASGLVSIAAR
jgi:hypothetical protein